MEADEINVSLMDTLDRTKIKIEEGVRTIRGREVTVTRIGETGLLQLTRAVITLNDPTCRAEQEEIRQAVSEVVALKIERVVTSKCEQVVNGIPQKQIRLGDLLDAWRAGMRYMHIHQGCCDFSEEVTEKNGENNIATEVCCLVFGKYFDSKSVMQLSEGSTKDLTLVDLNTIVDILNVHPTTESRVTE